MKRKHSLKNQNDNLWDKIFNVKTFGIMWGFLIGICIIAFFDIRVFASTQNTALPYLTDSFDNWTNYDGYTLSDLEEYYNNRWGQYYPLDFTGKVFAYEYTEIVGAWGEQHFTALIAPSASNSNYSFENQTDIYSQFDTTSDSITFVGYNYGIITFSTYRNGYNDPNFSGIGTQRIGLFHGGNYPEVASGNFYFNKNENGLITPSDDIIFGPSQPAVIVTGHATEPNLTDNDIDNNTKPDIDDYLPTLPTQPTIDNTSLESLVESLIDWLKWAYNGLTGTIKGFLQYIGDTITYSAQKIIDNIKNGINNLYQNFKSLFEPLLNSFSELLTSISEKLDYISQPFDSSALSDAFEETAIYSDIDSISQLTEDSFGVWSNTAEPNSFAIPLHTEQIYIDGHALTNTVQYIDFGVIDSVKTPIRAVMWCLVTFGLLYTIIDSIPNYIGGNDE